MSFSRKVTRRAKGAELAGNLWRSVDVEKSFHQGGTGAAYIRREK
jgi:hypothetical protein